MVHSRELVEQESCSNQSGQALLGRDMLVSGPGELPPSRPQQISHGLVGRPGTAVTA